MIYRRTTIQRAVSPARAGMDPETHDDIVGMECFPRTRGDGPRDRTLLALPSLLPPHARGWTTLALAGRARLHASPARAGMDQLRDESLNVGGGFPRTRGDGPADQDWATVGYQLPPHARGWTSFEMNP